MLTFTNLFFVHHCIFITCYYIYAFDKLLLIVLLGTIIISSYLKINCISFNTTDNYTVNTNSYNIEQNLYAINSNWYLNC